jgi:hypothetical protein
VYSGWQSIIFYKTVRERMLVSMYETKIRIKRLEINHYNKISIALVILCIILEESAVQETCMQM